MTIGVLWTETESATLCEMKAANCEMHEIVARLGRSVHSVKERWRWMTRTEDQKQERRNRVNANRNALRNGKPRTRVSTSVFNRVMPDDIFIERDRRINTPRTIGAELMGDPPPGYSALDRKRQSVSA